jgi:adenylate cyclase
MSVDEVLTLEDLRQLRGELLEPAVINHRGKVIKRMGDGWLIEFASAVDAVNCAMIVHNGLANHDRIKMRIGIHVGDIVHEDEDVYGDGVNIAARLQDCVEPGGLAISAHTYDSVKSSIAEKFTNAGQRQLKNIADETRIFVWGADLQPLQEGNVVKQPQSDRPKIIILPFAAATDDLDADQLADGLTDAVITALSRFSWFIVHSRKSSHAYKNRKASIVELRQDLDVDYILEGNLRRAGARVRVSAELLDARIGTQIWTDRFDGENDDPFELEDKITRVILAELTPRLMGEEARRAEFSNDGGAWDLIMQGRGLLWHVNETDVAEAQELFLKVIELEPDSGLGYTDLAWSYVYQRIYSWGGKVQEITERLREAADKAVASDNNDAFALTAASYARLLAGQSDDALAFACRAIELNPNLAVAHTALSLALFQQGRYEEAVEPGEEAVLLSPRDPLRSIMLAVRGMYYMMLGQTANSLTNSKEMVREYPGMPTGYRQLAVAYVENGQIDLARRIVDDHILNLMPGHTASESGRQVPFGENYKARELWVQRLTAAGLPE